MVIGYKYDYVTLLSGKKVFIFSFSISRFTEAIYLEAEKQT